jgi:hypothetical protein
MGSLRRARRAVLVGFSIAAVSVVVSVVTIPGLGWGLDAQAKRAHKAKTAPAAETDCKTDADCVVVPDDCCGCNQGGKQRAIAKKKKDGYEKDRKKRCGDTQCMEMISQDPSCSQHAMCGAGICELGG